MDATTPTVPPAFKGIALFTPGGDVVYCIDSNKQQRWHSHLCAALQQRFHLMEPPHFLVPCYAATIDRWVDSKNQQIHTIAEAAPAVLRFQPLLNAIFGTPNLIWQPASSQPTLCDPIILATYRREFPQLWESHDLVMQYKSLPEQPLTQQSRLVSQSEKQLATSGLVLRLFVSGKTLATERVLQSLHQLLLQSLNQPYTLKVIDVLRHPELAEADHISATPTLLKVWPHPVRRIVGNLDSPDQLLSLMDLASIASSSPNPLNKNQEPGSTFLPRTDS